MKISIISSSLNKKSRSIIMADFAAKILNEKDINTTVFDMRNYNIPLCDGSDYRKHADIKILRSAITESDAIIISLPIYNYGANAVIKNLIEWTGKAWDEKPVAFMCKAGGQNSYMSVMSLANNLMLNFRCIIMPRFVYALSSAFNEETTILVSEEIKKRIEQLCLQIIKIAVALKR